MGSKNFDHPQTLLEQRETHAAARVMVGLMTGGNGNRNEMEAKPGASCRRQLQCSEDCRE